MMDRTLANAKNIVDYMSVFVKNAARIFSKVIKINFRLICPSCLMFGIHKGHAVCLPEEATKNLRNKIDEAAKDGNNNNDYLIFIKGLLKFENSENVLLDIRHIKLTVEEKK